MDIISENSNFEGTFNFGKLTRIEGQIQGDISSNGTIIIGKTGKINGNIKSLDIIISGEINGNISSTNKILVENTAKITGDLKAPKIIIKHGAILNGEISMKEYHNEIESL